MATNKNSHMPTVRPADDRVITVVTHPRELHMYQVTDDELNNLETAGNYKTLDIALFALCLGISFSFVIALFSAPPPPGSISLYVFLVMAIVTTIGAVFFGFRARIAWKNLRSLVRQLKSNQ